MSGTNSTLSPNERLIAITNVAFRLMVCEAIMRIPAAASPGIIQPYHCRTPLHPVGVRHQQLQPHIPDRDHQERPERHLGGNVHLLRDLQHRHRYRRPHRRIGLFGNRNSLHRIHRRGHSPCRNDIFYPETDAATSRHRFPEMNACRQTP